MSVKLKFTPFRNISKVILVKIMTCFNLFRNKKISVVKTLQSFRNRFFTHLHQLSGAGISVFASILFILSVLVVGCENGTEPIYGYTPGISAKTLNLLWVFESEVHHQVEIQVSPPGLAADKTMMCLIKGESGGIIHFRLYDDGGLGTWNDSEGWADSKSGDTVPGDAIFSRRINSKFAARRGDYDLTFVFTTGPPPDSLHVKVSVIENSPPVVIRHETPEFIASGSDSDTFIAIIGDPDGFADVAHTELILFRAEQRFEGGWSHPMQRIDDSTWTFVSIPSMAVGLASNREYRIVYRTVDNIMSQGNQPQWVYSDSVDIRIENLPPDIIGVTGPDTVRIPREDSTYVFFNFEIEVRDDQGVNDLGTLFLSVLRDGEEKGNWEYIDGEGIDSTAGDGIYKAGFSADNTSFTHMIYTFDWTPSDRTGQRGETYPTYLVLVFDDEQLINRENNPGSRPGYIPFSVIQEGFSPK